MSKAKVEIINEEVKIRNFEDLEIGTVFEYEGHIYLKTDNDCEAILLSRYLGSSVTFYDEDSVIVYDHAMITVRTRAE